MVYNRKIKKFVNTQKKWYKIEKKIKENQEKITK